MYSNVILFSQRQDFIFVIAAWGTRTQNTVCVDFVSNYLFH